MEVNRKRADANAGGSRQFARRVITVMLFVMMVFTMMPLMMSEAGQSHAKTKGNPYPESYWEYNKKGEKTVYHPGNCTYQAWEEAYARLGIKLPNWHNGGEWMSNAKKDGYTVIYWKKGYIPPSNCVLEMPHHVAWVISADKKGIMNG